MGGIDFLALVVPVTIGGIVALVGLLFIAFGLRGRMVPMRARCLHCRHELHDDLSARCGECGADPTQRDAVGWGRPRIRFELVGLGAVLVVGAGVATPVALVLLSTVRASEVTPRLANSLTPTELRTRLTAETYPDPLWMDAWRAVADDSLSSEQVLAIGHVAGRRWRENFDPARHQATNADGQTGAADHFPGTVFQEVLAVPRLSDHERDELIAAAARGLPLHGPRLIREGDGVFLIPNNMLRRGSDFMPHVTIDAVVEAVTLDGEPLALVSMPHPTRDARAGGVRPGPAREPVGVVLREPGVHELEVTLAIHYDITATPLSLRLRSLPNLLAPISRRVLLPPIVHRVEVAGLDEQLPRPVADVTMRERIASSIAIDRVVIAQDIDGERHVLQAVVSLTPVDEVAMEFDVVARFVTDPDVELTVGSVAAEQPHYSAWFRRDIGLSGHLARRLVQEAWCPPLPPSIRTVTITLSPRSGAWIRTIGADAHWALPVEFTDVPVIRLDLDDSEADGSVPENRP